MNDWQEKLEYSLGQQQAFDIALLKKHIPRCESIRKTDIEQDKSGVDYVATLAHGAEVLIDAKTRTPGSSKYWANGEAELALEVWSVIGKKVGWTLSTKTNVDYILYTFDKSDWDKYYFLPFQSLRKAFHDNFHKWAKEYKQKKQSSGGWESAAIFVPVSVVLQAMRETMEGAA